MIEELKRPDRLDEDRIEAIKALFPEAFPDGRFNAQALKELLDDPNEAASHDTDFYGLKWPGKKQARKNAAISAKTTLAFENRDPQNSDDFKHFIIEGDNLEVMKILLKAYGGKIKVIYIDPPYNTGRDFVYNDNYFQKSVDYLSLSGQSDFEGLLVSNPKIGGRYHTNWLNMILSRIVIAKSLLTEDGTIFVSIDENEQANLRLLMDEVFGEENFIGQFIWKSRQNKDNRTVTGLSQDHEYVIAYGRKVSGDLRDTSQYTNPDNDSRGPWASANMVGLLPENERPNLHYDLINHKTGDVYPKPAMGWRYDINTMRRLIDEDRILWPRDLSGRPRRKVFLDELASNTTGISSVLDVGVYTKDGTEELEQLFGERVLEFPKPTALIEKIIQQGFGLEDGIILDFFAGSGTTGQATLQFNANNGRNIQFILVQLPVEIPVNHVARSLGYEKISDITKARIEKYLKSENVNVSVGHLALVSSNLRKYRSEVISTIDGLATLDFSGSGTLIPDYKPQNVITEMMLLEGFPLESRIEQAPEFDDQVYVVSHPERSHRLLISLTADPLSDQTVEQASQYPKDTFICLESSLTDQSKIRLADAVAKVKTL